MQFQVAKPFRHVIIDNFLDSDLCQGLLDQFPIFEERYALNEMGKVSGKASRADVKNLASCYQALDAYLQTSEFLGYMSMLTGIPELHYDPDYVGGGTHENRDGQSLAPHVDFNFHPGTKEHRRLNLIVYLNKEWHDEWGGALALHADPWSDTADRKKLIAPLLNRAAVFETNEVSWHSFEKIRLPDDRKGLSRKSFAIYLYTKDRPQEELASEHATIYVPDGMPRGWQIGRQLNSDDLFLLERRFSDLRGMLNFLYDREKRFAAQLKEAESSYRLPLQGYAQQLSAPLGYWQDGWVGVNFRTTFIVRQSLKAVELSVHVPPEIDGAQELKIEVNGRCSTHTVAGGSHSDIKVSVSCTAGTAVEIRVSAATSFMPSAHSSTSTDVRKLSWLMRSMRLWH